jgi:DNA-binding transcriptional ArsR family regulator
MARRGRRGKNRNESHWLVAALRHPLRREILRLLADGREISPSEMAEELGEPLSTIAYHVRVLAECGALKQVRERKVRGATQRFYSSSLEADWARAMLEADDEESSGGKP